MKLNKISNTLDGSGTSHIGYIKTTYANLVDKLGEPTYTGYEEDKVQAEWVLSFTSKDGREIIATIYDWKQYEQGIPTDEYAWHVGGRSTDAIIAVSDLLGIPSFSR
jgi:hypothetical protein